MMTDGASILNDGIGSFVLNMLPLFNLLTFLSSKYKGKIQTGTSFVRVRNMSKNYRRTRRRVFFNCLLNCFFHSVVQLRNVGGGREDVLGGVETRS